MTSARAFAHTVALGVLLGCGASHDQPGDAGKGGSAEASGDLDAQNGVRDANGFAETGAVDGGPIDSAATADGSSPDGLTDGALFDAGPLPPDPCVEAGTCPPGVWVNVTPANMDAAILRPTKNAFGPGSIVGDPARPNELYVGGSSAGLWKSSDYGSTWTRINSTLPDVPRGVTIAVAGTTPATVWAAGYNTIYKSIDGGLTFQQTALTQSLYSLKVDPNDTNHLISGLHEVDGLMESTDGGATWKTVGGVNWPSGGKSWYPYFIDTGNQVTTSHTWFAIAQNGGSAVTTGDSGAHWTVPNGLSGLQHPHGNSQIFQSGSTLFVAGIAGPGQGVYRSTDIGANWTRVDNGKTAEALVWGSAKNVYAMYAWACSNCNLGVDYETAPQPGVTWSTASAPSALTIGPNSVAVTNDGSHFIFVAVMWDQGIWRYVEP
jgi:photosystem II stability/assembly factor-like uncharacterized protein